jgi:hypothetical protein
MKSFISFIIISLTLIGCDLFSTRDSEKPVTPRTTYEFPATPQAVINNLTNSFIEKDIQNQLSCLADSNFSNKSYLFIPSSGSAVIYPGFATAWDRKSENQYLTNLFAQVKDNEKIAMTLSDASLHTYGDSALYAAHYTLTIPKKNNSVAAVYQGEMHLSLIQDSRPVWVIYLWQDIKTSDVPNWSDLRGFYY